MNPRERLLIVVIGSAIGLWAAYKAGVALFISPVTEADAKIAELDQKLVSLTREKKAASELGDRWGAFSRRTYSGDPRDAVNRFVDELQGLATRHHLAGVSLTPLTSGRIPKSDIRTVSVRMVGVGKAADVTGFLAEVYALPVLITARKLRLTPENGPGGVEQIKIGELLLETLVLPTVDPATEPMRVELRGLTTLPTDPQFIPPSIRDDLIAQPDRTLLATRNIFVPYVPPPPVVVSIDNQDLKAVDVRMRFFWRGESSEQPVGRVEGKSKRDLSGGAGDRVEIVVTYADGKTFGPQTLSPSGGQPVMLAVPAHTPPPPPRTFAYKVRNDGPEPVEIEAIVTRGGTPRTLPLMKVPPKTPIDLPELEGERLTLTGLYADGSRAMPGSYDVTTASTGMYVIPAKAAAPAVVQAPPVALPPPDPDLQVTALLRHPAAHELVALSAKTRKRQIIKLGEAVDGGKLVRVDPAGGIVQMPGNTYFLYPLGKKFPERVQLDARADAEIPAAIARWNQQ